MLEDRYELGRILGAGGMGAVFEARHLRLDRPVAIKVLRPVFAGHDEYIKRFLREAKAASKIRHRNVVEILDYGEAGEGLVYSVMEFLVGQDLEQLLCAQPEGRLPWARACGLLVQIASGLKAAHGQGVIHRDIKPANCFLTEEDGEPIVKLVDFGIAKIEENDQTHPLTATDQVLGTPAYIAPELVRTGGPASPRSDIYSLGVLAYRMLTGRVPFTANTVFEILRRACFEPVPSLTEQVPELPSAEEALVLELLAKKPDDRPIDMLDVRERLLALSRETLGAQAVEIPASSALTLDAETSGRRDVPHGATPMHDEVARGSTVRSEAPPVGLTVSPLELEPSAPHQRSLRPLESASAEVKTPSGTHEPVHEAVSSSSKSGETMPAVGPATLPLADSSPLYRPRREGKRELVLGGLVALVIGAVAVPLILGGEEHDALAHEDSLVVDAGDGPSVEDGSIAAVPGDVAVPQDEPIVEVPADTDDGGTSSTTARVVDHDVDSSGTGETGSITSVEETDPPPQSSDADPIRAKPSTPVNRTRRTHNSSKAGTPATPPSDAVLVAKIKKAAKSRCPKPATGEPIIVSFMVSADGEVLDLSVTPEGPIGSCALVQVEGMVFRPRTESVDKKVVVR